MHIRSCFAAAALLAAASMGSAATFTVNLGTGSSTIGTGGDYTSLAEAITDLNGAQAVTGNYTFYILNDLAEPANVGIGKNTNGFTITFKPAVGVSPTITWGATVDNPQISGHFVVGQTSAEMAKTTAGGGNIDNIIPTKNIVIDGSNTVGGTTRDMTFQNTLATPVYNNAVPFRVQGDCDGFILKNCKVLQKNPANGGHGVSCILRRTNGGTAGANLDVGPDNVKILNNEISLTGGGYTGSAPVNFSNSQQAAVTGPPAIPANPVSVGVVMTGFEVRDNVLVGYNRGIFLNYVSNGVVRNNKVTLQGVAGFGLDGIFWNSANAFVGPASMVISGNDITGAAPIQHATTALTMMGINMGGGPNELTLEISNNIIRSLEYTPAADYTVAGAGVRGISFASAGTKPTYRIYNNSVNIPNQPKLTNNDPWRTVGLASMGGTTLEAVLEMKGNIVRVADDRAFCVAIQAYLDTVTDFDRNVLFNTQPSTNTNAGVGYKGSTTFAAASGAQTLDAWKTATNEEANSQNVDPTVTAGSAWDATLHFVPATVLPTGINLVPATAYAATAPAVDFDAQARPAAGSLPGADHVVTSASVSDWSVF